MGGRDWRVIRDPSLPFYEIRPGFPCGVWFLGIGKPRIGVGVFVTQIGQHVAGFVGDDVRSGRATVTDGDFIEAIGTAGPDIVDQQHGELTPGHEGLQQGIHFALAVAVIGIGEVRRNSYDTIRRAVVSAVEERIVKVGAAGAIGRMVGARLVRWHRNGKGVAVTAVLLVRRTGEKAVYGVGRVQAELPQLVGRVSFREHDDVKTVGNWTVGQDRDHGGLGKSVGQETGQQQESDQCRVSSGRRVPPAHEPRWWGTSFLSAPRIAKIPG